MNREPINHLPLREEVSGIEQLNARDRKQRIRDNDNWFEGFLTGGFWGAIFGALIVFVLIVTFTR